MLSDQRDDPVGLLGRHRREGGNDSTTATACSAAVNFSDRWGRVR
jgi:hypothetical protein